MSQFISLTLFFIIITGSIIHFGVEVPYVEPWLGQLPGDLVIAKGNLKIYVPIASSVIASLALSFLGSLFGKAK